MEKKDYSEDRLNGSGTNSANAGLNSSIADPKKGIELKDLEIILWALPGIIFLFCILFIFRSETLFKDPALALDLLFSFFPFLFANLFSLVYNDFPFYYWLGLLKEIRTEKQ